MKFVRYQASHQEAPRPGVVDGLLIRDLSTLISDISVPLVLSKWDELRAVSLSSLPLVGNIEDIRWAACLPRPGKIICVGFNSKQHVKELGLQLPNSTCFFLKSNECINRPFKPYYLSEDRTESRLGGRTRRDYWEVWKKYFNGKSA